MAINFFNSGEKCSSLLFRHSQEGVWYMRIINSTGQKISVKSYRNRARDISWKDVGEIPNNGSKELNMSEDKIELLVKYHDSGDVEDSRYGWNPSGWIFAGQHEIVDYPNTTLVIITSHPGHRIIDWKRVTAPYHSGINQLTGGDKQVTDDVQAGIDAGYSIVAALTTSIAAMGPVGALPSGMVMGLGSLLLMALGANGSVPPAPNADEIERIVAKVVKRELDKQDAEKAATAFALATTELLRLGDKVNSYVKAHSAESELKLNHHLEEDIERFIHQSTGSNGEGTLLFSLKHMMNYPEMGMWVLPQLVQGIGTYLTCLRLHLLISSQSETDHNNFEVPMGDIEFYKNEVDGLFEGLKHIYLTAKQYVNKKTEAVGLQNTLQEDDFKNLVIKSMYGLDYLDDPIIETLHDLERISIALQAIIDSGITSRFWRKDSVPG
jgi:hypothetical protein